MAIKKTSGGDSPLWQGAGKSFWTLLIGCLGFFRRGVFISEGAASEVDQVGLTIGRHGQALGRAPWWSDHPLARFRLLFGLLEASLNIWMFGFCFVQFREYFLCNFSETQK
jgi:hypothetical protein